MSVISGDLQQRSRVFLKPKPVVEEPILDSSTGGEGEVDPVVISEEILDAAAEDFGSASVRSMAMAAALTFIEGDDYSFSAIDALMQGAADVDGDGEVSEDEEDIYNDMIEATCEAFAELGADKDQIKEFIEGEDDKKGAAMGAALSKGMDSQVLDDAGLICRFAVAENLEEGIILDAAKVKRVVNGKFKMVRKPLKKKRLSSAQKAGLKKARRKSNTSKAKMKRAKSMKMRKARGI